MGFKAGKSKAKTKQQTYLGKFQQNTKVVRDMEVRIAEQDRYIEELARKLESRKRKLESDNHECDELDRKIDRASKRKKYQEVKLKEVTESIPVVKEKVSIVENKPPSSRKYGCFEYCQPQFVISLICANNKYTLKIYLRNVENKE